MLGSAPSFVLSEPSVLPSDASASAVPQSKSAPSLALKLLDASYAELPDSGTIHIGDTVTVAVEASGVEDARFNYVWVRDNDWSEGSWDSTINSGNPPTNDAE